MKNIVLIVFIFLASAASAQTTTIPQTRNLKSSDGVQIKISYVLKGETTTGSRPIHTDTAENIVIEVSGDVIRSSDRVRLALVNYENTRGYCGQQPSSTKEPNYIVDLKLDRDSRTFKGEFKDGKILVEGREVPLRREEQKLLVNVNGYCTQTLNRQEVAVVVNGKWLVDPKSGTNSYKLNLLW